MQHYAASRYLAGLVDDSTRKSVQAMHGRLSDAGTYQALHHLMFYSPSAVGPVWARVRAVVPDRSGILAIDDAEFSKQENRSIVITRKCCGDLGKAGN